MEVEETATAGDPNGGAEMICGLAEIRMKQFESNGYTREDFVNAHKFLGELHKYGPLLRPEMRATLRHQALSGDPEGAATVLRELLAKGGY